MIEHYFEIMAEADCLIEIGPGAVGTPEEVSAGESPTGPYLRGHLGIEA